MDCVEMKCQVAYSHISFLFDLREFPKSDEMTRWGDEKHQLLPSGFLLLYVFFMVSIWQLLNGDLRDTHLSCLIRDYKWVFSKYFIKTRFQVIEKYCTQALMASALQKYYREIGGNE